MPNNNIFKERICEYWDKRSENFAKLRKEELYDSIADRWLSEIEKYISLNGKLKILDVGTGTGFFAILMSKLGHEAVGVDLSEKMIAYALELKKEENVSANFFVMDAEKLDFDDYTFDLVISRNLMWTLTSPEDAYAEWVRVLKKGGTLLNFDANYGNNSFLKESRLLPQNHAHKSIDYNLLKECDEINKNLPLKGQKRPHWDKEILFKMGCKGVINDAEISKRIYIVKDKFYNPTPMFLVRAVK